jgi:hypothetical protein
MAPRPAPRAGVASLIVEFAAPLKPASPDAVAGWRDQRDPMPMPMPPSVNDQLNFNGYAAAVWADRLRSFYETLPGELAPERHWDLLLEIAVNAPEARMEDLRVAGRSDGPISQPGGCSLSG